MTEHLVNSWESTQSSSVEGDPIVALSWLHNGVKLALHVEKARRQFQPTVVFPLLSLTQVLNLYPSFCRPTVRLHQLRREVLAGEVLSVADSFRWEAHGGLAGCDGERLSERVPAEA